MKTLSQSAIHAFQATIFDWWKTHRRDLPWRNTNDPYKILVSEIMLQQTQVSRGLPKYLEFIETFPTVTDLAHASPSKVLKLWKGMGYNRRALYLQESAKKILTDFAGKFPQTEEELLSLPGLGIYTARAVLVFAYRQDMAMVDTNIRQIITHFFFHDEKQSEKVIQEVADKLVPKGKSWDWHQALMDYGAIAMINAKLQMLHKRRKLKKINPVVPFKETNRYFRGRIMDLLREKEYEEKELIGILCSTYGKDEQFYIGLLKTLENEGLAVYKTGYWKLPV
jgi:A/G-specific adenine glycosylase